MVLLLDKRLVLRKLCKQLGSEPRDLVKEIHPDREVRSVQHRAAALVHDPPHFVLIALPAGRALDQRYTRRDGRGHMLDHRAWTREVDGRRVAGQQPRRFGCIAGCDHGTDLVTRLAGLRLHHAGHPAVADQRELHATLPVGSKNV